MNRSGRGYNPRPAQDRLSAEIPDIFIPPTTIDNAGVISGRNENSGMTIGGEGRSGAWERQKGARDDGGDGGKVFAGVRGG